MIRVVLVAGAGLSAPQLPGWVKLLENMLQWTRRECIPLASPYEEIAELIKDDDLLLAAQTLRSQMGEPNFQRFIQETFRHPNLRPTPVHGLLPSIAFSAVLTTNYDKLIEQAYPAGTRVFTQLDHAGLALLNRQREFAIVKVHGDADRPETIVLGQADYRQIMFGDDAFRIFLTNTLTTQIVLFTGYSLTDPDLLAFLDALTFQLKGNLGGAHFALMRTHGLNAIKRRNFEERWGSKRCSSLSKPAKKPAARSTATPSRSMPSLMPGSMSRSATICHYWAIFGTGKTWFTRRLAVRLAAHFLLVRTYPYQLNARTDMVYVPSGHLFMERKANQTCAWPIWKRASG
jgi:hypothetical protein